MCASGIRAAGLIDTAILAGDLEIGVGGGMESMSNAPYLLPGARFGWKMGDVEAMDAMVDGLTNPFSGRQMFDEATEVGDELELLRGPTSTAGRCARTSARSPPRTRSRLPDEIVPVTTKGRKGDTVVEVDEGPRLRTDLEKLAALPGLVGKEGSHTAGNSPGVGRRGARARIDEWASSRQDVLATIVTTAQVADDFYLALPSGRARRWRRRACRPTTSACGRSTRPSPR